MKKIIGLGLLAAACANAYADPVSWTQWNGYTRTGSFTQNGHTVDVTYEGPAFSMSYADLFSGYSAYQSTEVSNGPGGQGFLQIEGGPNTAVHHLHFSTAVADPYLAIISLGQPGLPATFSFQNVSSIDLVSTGQGAYGNGPLTVTGSVVSGNEGHGIVQLNGVYTDLYFTTPQQEYWYGATFGAPAIAAVPEPGTWAMLLAGGAMLGLVGRRRHAEKFSRPA
jgi:hypothetical protein